MEHPASNREVAGEIPAGSTNSQGASDGNSAYLASSNLAVCRCKSGLAHQFAPMTGTSIPHWLKPSGVPVQLWLGAPITERTRIVSFPHRLAKPAFGNGLRGQHPSSPPISARGVKSTARRITAVALDQCPVQVQVLPRRPVFACRPWLARHFAPVVYE